jgi:hypothetical protein
VHRRDHLQQSLCGLRFSGQTPMRQITKGQHFQIMLLPVKIGPGIKNAAVRIAAG